MGTMSVPSSKGVDNRPQPSTSFSNVEKNPSICSVSQFFVAVAIGLVNGMLFVAFIMPFAAAWLAWKQPYLVLPAAVAYYFLSCDGSERKTGRPWMAFSEKFFVFRLAREYSDFQVHLDPALDAVNMVGDEKFIFALHPHGVMSTYRILLDGILRKTFPKLRSWRALGASVLFYAPIMRELTLWSHVVDAGRKTAQYNLDKGHSLFIVPGGEHEQILCQFGKEILYLKSRMGFVKLALRNDIPLVPGYVFGANDEYHTSTFLQSLRLSVVRRLRVALPLFWGRFGLMIPRQVPLRVVFGAPISFGKQGGGSAGDSSGSGSSNRGGGDATGGLRDVSDEELKEAHAAYIVAVKKLFDDNKARFGYAERELQIL